MWIVIGGRGVEMRREHSQDGGCGLCSGRGWRCCMANKRSNTGLGGGEAAHKGRDRQPSRRDEAGQVQKKSREAMKKDGGEHPDKTGPGPDLLRRDHRKK